MEIKIDTKDSVNIISLNEQRIDVANAQLFKKAMAGVIEEAGFVVLDLSSVLYVDSSGLGSIISCLKQIKGNGGELKLCHMSKEVRTIFELVRMHRVFDIYNDQEEAVKACLQ